MNYTLTKQMVSDRLYFKGPSDLKTLLSYMGCDDSYKGKVLELLGQLIAKGYATEYNGIYATTLHNLR